MLGLPAQESKFKSDNCINMQMLTTKNKIFQTTTEKSSPSNNNTTYALENNEIFSSITSTKYLHRYKSKSINEDKDDNTLFDPVISTKHLRGCRNKHVGKGSKDNESKSQTMTPPTAVITRHLANRKTAYAIVYGNSSKKTETPTHATIT